jgi:hypothetical protein
MIAAQRLCSVSVVLLGCMFLLGLAFSHATFVSNFVDSDGLLAAEWTRHIFIDGYPASGYQLPRTPSLFPDLTLYSLVQLATGSWRAATFGTLLALLAGLLCAGGIIVGRIATIRTETGIAAFWIAGVAIILAELAFSGAGRHLLAVKPMAHGASFVLSVIAAALADSLRRRFAPVRATGFATLCILAVLSDRLFVVSFVIPFGVALFAVEFDRRVRIVLLTIVASASLAGWAGGGLIDRQADLALDWTAIPAHLRLFLLGIRASDVVTIAPALLLFIAPVFARGLAVAPDGSARFYWTFAVVSIVATTGLTVAFLYQDRGAYRYLGAAIWWPYLFAAAGLAVMLRRRAVWIAGLASIVSATIAVLAIFSGFASRDSLWRWRHPVEQCLSRDSGMTQPREGLAQFWLARPIGASSEWRFHVDPILPTGEAHHWGNDLASYSQSTFDRSRPPDYRFIVMDSLDPVAIAARFGEPARTLDCGDTIVWFYGERLTVPTSSVSPK